MKKKLLVTLLVLIMVCTSLIGCGGNSSSDNDLPSKDDVNVEAGDSTTEIEQETDSKTFVEKLGINVVQGNNGVCISEQDYVIFEIVDEAPTDANIVRYTLEGKPIIKTNKSTNEIPVRIEIIKANDSYDKEGYIYYEIRVFFETPFFYGHPYFGVHGFDKNTGIYLGSGEKVNEKGVYKTKVEQNGKEIDIYYRECEHFGINIDDWNLEDACDVIIEVPKDYDGLTFYLCYNLVEEPAEDLSDYKTIDELPFFNKDKGLFIQFETNN